MKLSVITILFICWSSGWSVAVSGEKISEDRALAEKLKSELNFNLQRRKGFKKQIDDQKIYDLEREKGLALFLEEQEKFDLLRQKGLAEYKKNKKKPLDESSPEYFLDLKEKENRKKWQEQSRLTHIQTRDQVISLYNNNSENHSEFEELDLSNSRPRFDLGKRYNNKWVKNSTKQTGSSGSSSFPGAPAPDVPNEFPAPIDYAPQPIDNFEEIPPPPPILYDQSQGYDSGFGDSPMPPAPPPPPEGGWDF